MLRDYQTDTITKIRAEFARGKCRICVCLPTGAGKSHIAAGLMQSMLIKNPRARIWFCLPRLELISQMRLILEKDGIYAGELSARAKDFTLNVCICSKNTLIRVKNPPSPDFIFFDEAHIAIQQRRSIAEQYPSVVIIGLTATPEIADGRPMMFTKTKTQTLGLYDTLVATNSIPQLQREHALAKLDYKSISAKDAVKFGLLDKGLIEVSGQALDTVLCYGDIVTEYEKYGKGKPSIGFAPAIELADKCVDVLNNAGYKWKRISGDMPLKKRKALISELVSGGIDGLVNAMLLTYGFDAPCVEYAFSVRYVRSRNLWVQMVGRILRPSPGKDTAVFCDLTGCCYNFQEDNKPFFFNDENPRWDFKGKNIVRCQFIAEHVCINRQKKKLPHCVWNKNRLCVTPLYYFDKLHCGKEQQGCFKLIKPEPPDKHKQQKDIEQMNMNIVSVNMQYEIKHNFLDGKLGKQDAIAQLFRYAEIMGYHYMWVYWFINEGKREVDKQTLQELAVLKGYKPQWVHFKAQQIKDKLNGRLQK
ncbi:MAG: DEAD/DEAH box helicase family protein [Treponema sp.]|jgi:superfamily II DNA or RNA helicase|nr:DEAD/DEAH box helicase family protein [Treponema sp.]